MRFNERLATIMSGGTKPTLRENVQWGILCGVLIALILSAIGFVIALRVRSAGSDREEVSFVQALTVYWVGGITGGVLLGVFRPLLGTIYGRILAASVVILPAFTLFEFLDETRALGTVLLRSVIISAFVGPVYGISWHIYEKYSGGARKHE